LGENEEDDAREDAGDLSGVVASGSKSKCATPVTVATQQPRKKKKAVDATNEATNTRAHSTAQGKGKKKASSIEDEAEDEDEDDNKIQDSNVDQGEDSAVDMADLEG
jgi:hypothetical protein